MCFHAKIKSRRHNWNSSSENLKMFYYHDKQTWEIVWLDIFYCQINSPYTQLATARTGDVTFLKTIIFLTIKEIFTKCSQFLHEKLSCRSTCRARWSASVQKVFRLTSFRKTCDMISVVPMSRTPLHRLIDPFQVKHFSIRTLMLGAEKGKNVTNVPRTYKLK